jgi:integrase
MVTASCACAEKAPKVVRVPLPPAVERAIDQAIGARTTGPILLNSRGARMDRHAATRRLRRLAEAAGIRITRAHPHMLRHTFVITMQGRGVVSDASFPGKRDDGAIRDPGPSSPTAACSAWRETAGQHGRVRTGLRQKPRCGNSFCNAV